MQGGLDTLSEDAEAKHMEANPLKCEALYVIPPQRKRPITLPDLQLNGTPLPVVTTCKLLGVHLNTHLNWNDHVIHMVKKATKCIFILHRAKKFNFSTRSLLTLYQWFVRTGLEYAAPVWHAGLTQHQHQRIERIQKRCCRIIMGNQYESYGNALQQLRISSLFDRREMLTLRFGRSLLRSPAHRHLMPPTNGDIHGRNTRNRDHLRPIRPRTERYRRSTIPYIVNMLNNAQ